MDNGHFTRLAGDECRQLVRGHSVGRVAWLSGEGLQVLPVAYAASADQICFHVDPESVMGELAGPIRVAFEVDDIDVPTATGWSVLVRGDAEARDSVDDLELPAPWAPGRRSMIVAITPIAYSGRAVSAGDPRS